MNPFISTPGDCVNRGGWTRLPSGVEISCLPVYDERSDLFARLGHGPFAELFASRGSRHATATEYEELHKLALHIDPYTLPTESMLAASGVPKPYMRDGKDTPAMARWRAANMRSEEWCRDSDATIWERLKRAGWRDGTPVANALKHWGAGGIIVGWWRKDGRKIQTASKFHAGDPTYTDYATGAHEVRMPAMPPVLADDWTLAQRCLFWCGQQLGFGVEEISGPVHNPTILGYSTHCRRGGTFLGVGAMGSPRWDGGLSVALPSDEDAWCAAFQSESLRASLREGEAAPHGLRVAVRELVDDMRANGRLRGAMGYTPMPGDLVFEGRNGESPLRGGHGHVYRVIQVVDEQAWGIGGNELNRIQVGWRPLARALAFGAYYP